MIGAANHSFTSTTRRSRACVWALVPFLCPSLPPSLCLYVLLRQSLDLSLSHSLSLSVYLCFSRSLYVNVFLSHRGCRSDSLSLTHTQLDTDNTSACHLEYADMCSCCMHMRVLVCTCLVRGLLRVQASSMLLGSNGLRSPLDYVVLQRSTWTTT